MNSENRSIPSWQATVIVVVLALAASVSSLGNGFALDDVHIIAANERVHTLSGWWTLFGQTYWPPEHGASLYRPMTMLLFAMQWTAGSGSPLPFHIVNVTLYVGLSVAVLSFARRLMPPQAALIGAGAFAIHPVHVEAVANVVGQSELWVALLLVFSLTFYLRVRSARKLEATHIAALCFIYLTALFFKEHAIVLPGLIAAAELIVVSRNGAPLLQRLSPVTPLLLGMTTVAAGFVAVRAAVIGQFSGGSTALVLRDQDFPARAFTMLEVFPEWVRLFVWPAQLSANYSPGRIETVTSFDVSMMPAVVAIVALAVIGVRIRKNHPGAAFALSFAGIALLIPSNLIIVTGFVLAERALLLASVGVMLAIGFAAHFAIRAASPVVSRLTYAGLSALVMAGISVSASRGLVWKDNETLFRQTVIDVPTSYRAHLMLGELLTEVGDQEEGLLELAKAVSLSYPQNSFVRRFAAERFHAAGKHHVARRYYEEAITVNPDDQAARLGLTTCLFSMGDTEAARSTAAKGLSRDPVEPRFVRIVHVIDSVAAVSRDVASEE